jgi:hypothetical protein
MFYNRATYVWAVRTWPVDERKTETRAHILHCR